MKITLKKFQKLVKGVIVKYVLGLILSKSGKTCSMIASLFGISHDVIYRFLSANEELTVLFPDLMINLVNYFHALKPGWLIIDDTSLSKNFAKFIEGVYWVYNSSLGRPEYGLCIVVIAWSNGDITIPIAFDWWFSEEITKNRHKTKIAIAQRLLVKVKDQVKHTHILSDAAYISVDMIKFHEIHKNLYINRIHSTRKVETFSGACEQIKNHPSLRLNRNQRAKVTAVTIQGQKAYIVSFKRFKQRSCEYETVYLITNINRPAREIVEMYEGRWHIEPIFRTSKQHLGLALCQARSIEKQNNHVRGVFIGYAFLQYEKYLQKFNCPEAAMRLLQASNLNDVSMQFERFCRDFAHAA
jgi:putative transposase